jgi:hypothetical protein
MGRGVERGIREFAKGRKTYLAECNVSRLGNWRCLNVLPIFALSHVPRAGQMRCNFLGLTPQALAHTSWQAEKKSHPLKKILDLRGSMGVYVRRWDKFIWWQS